MISVDTNVFMYTVGRIHPLHEEAKMCFLQAFEQRNEFRLCTSAKVLQALLHAYLPFNRLETLDAALKLAYSSVMEIWFIEEQDMQTAWTLVDSYHGLGLRT